MPTLAKAYLGDAPLFVEVFSDWRRPADWLDLPSIGETQGFNAVHAVYATAANFCSLQVTTTSGPYTVDWGDGPLDANGNNTPNIETVASGASAYHNFNYASVSSSTLSTRGYRQAIVKVRPVSGNLAVINLHSKHNQAGLPNAYSSGWLDLVVNGPSLTGLQIGGNTVTHRLLEHVAIISWGTTKSFGGLFQGCSRLQSISIEGLSTAGATNVATIFSGCTSLKKIDIAGWNVSSTTTLGNMFQNCGALQEIDISNWLPTAATAAGNMFANCVSLAKVSFANWVAPALSSVFSMFAGCGGLRELGPFNAAAVTDFSSFVLSCPSLARCQWTNINASISFANCSLSGAALNEIYGNLSNNGAGKYITVSGNYGTATHNTSIATAKGWGVIG